MILLVDDNQHLIAVTRRHLAGWGYTVVAVASGPSALTFSRWANPSICCSLTSSCPKA